MVLSLQIEQILVLEFTTLEWKILGLAAYNYTNLRRNGQTLCESSAGGKFPTEPNSFILGSWPYEEFMSNEEIILLRLWDIFFLKNVPPVDVSKLDFFDRNIFLCEDA